jgi:hypothetical protein
MGSTACVCSEAALESTYVFIQMVPFTYLVHTSFNAATSTRVPSVPMVISTAGQRLPVRVMDIQGWFTVYTPNRGQRAPGVAWLVTDKQQMSPV